MLKNYVTFLLALNSKREVLVKGNLQPNISPLVGFATVENITEQLRENYRMLLIGHDVANNASITRILETINKVTEKP